MVPARGAVCCRIAPRLFAATANPQSDLTHLSIALFICSGRRENGRPARDLGPNKTIKCSRVALGLGWYRAAELGQSLAYNHLIKCFVEGIGKLGDHLGRD